VALANKESMVVAGSLIQAEARKSGAQIIPVDSEHSGIFQCLTKEQKENVKKVILTASGGPFFETPLEEMKYKTLEETLAHPRWKMGKKVTVDSATLMNKGLELIEALWLFGFEPSQLEILIHPQSVVHSLVEMRDGSILAQISPTDMKIPIQYALTYPHRENSLLPSLDLSKLRVLEFYEVDEERFPLIKLARRALREGGSFPVALNAANEMAVTAFLKQEIKFSDISDLVRKVVEDHQKRKVRSLDDIFDVDRETREKTWNLLKQRY
jgi:1-deoxy-D-xylulose-5-phosphate reductoisomerase